MNPIKSKANYSGYLTSLQSENTVRMIPQPVKIAQLFGSSGHLQSGQRNSSIKINLPERITPYLKKPSSQKKNVTNTCIKLPRNERNARRNLKFTETLNSVTKIEKCAKAGTNDENNYPKKENLGLATRRSFLLPPNTIKELYIKNRKQNKLEVSQFRILTVSSENTNPRLAETSTSCSPPMANISTHVDSVVNVKKNKTSLIQSISSQTFNVNEQSGINILHSSYSDLADTDASLVEKIPENLTSNDLMSNVNICESQNNDCDIIINRSHVSLSSASDTNVRIDTDLLHNDDDVDRNNICCAERHSRLYTTFILPNAEKVKEAENFSFKKVDREGSSSTTSSTNIYEDFYSSLQTVKMISETCLNQQRSTNEDERATLSKTELTVLGAKLNHLVCRLEEDMSDLKLTLTTVTKLLSATNMANKEIKDNNETKITQQIIEITENLNDNVKAMDTEHDNTLKETHKMLDINRSNFLETNGKDNPEMQLADQMYFASGSDKENKEILTSPIVKQCKKLENLNAANDSFVNLENELDIVNRKSNIPITPFTNQTPAKNKYQNQNMQERPMKEYMALKSRMSCLLTPNIKRFNPSESRNNIHCETDNAKISVSNKLLAELYNLYEDSL
ncbi:uncharacterized protein LOC112464425 [Temnothorax curvispinosus]|uniref:Uncharacterized protein LOC112464425 n=1 Tax=Temnothorax curvispinosus TaxID=300111 RepID=A0A6J1QXW3_9HYME|nr:uncharacterized protein LOC112464425 [Temnothorax curvispinosus]